MSEKSCGSSSCEESSCEGCSHSQSAGIQKEILNQYSTVQSVIGIVSGKGGVGKSTVTSLLARKLASQGYRVGIMDADITGPSIPKMFGASGTLYGTQEGIIPFETQEGIKIVSMNLLLEEEEAPVVLRGPVIAGVVKQFWTDVFWGELDYLLIDMPPGTGDVPLTVYQSIPVDGIVIVTSPQDLVRMIVMKAVNMAAKMEVPLLGLVENYSYFQCTDCGTRLSIFGESGIDELAAELNTKVLAKLPINPEIAKSADAGMATEVELELDIAALTRL